MLKEEYEGYIFSKNTLKTEHLLESFLDFVEEELQKESGAYPQHAPLELRDEAEKLLRLLQLTEHTEYRKWRAEADWTLEQIFDYMNEIAPEGYYFGSQEGDGALFGFWENRKEEV